MNPAALQFEEAPRIVFFDTNFFRALLKGNFHQHMADLESDLREAILCRIDVASETPALLFLGKEPL